MAETKEEVEKLEKKIYEKKLLSLVFSGLVFLDLDYMIHSFYDNYVKAKQNICEKIEKFSL